jgi:plastocyanin domain-containing protein
MFGVAYSSATTDTATASPSQTVESTLQSSGLPDITVQVGLSVRWIINADDTALNGNNRRINIPEYGISEFELKSGANVIEFTPTQTGVFTYSDWMGMNHGTITVTE